MDHLGANVNTCSAPGDMLSNLSTYCLLLIGPLFRYRGRPKALKRVKGDFLAQ